MSELEMAFRWYISLQAIGLAGLPLCRVLFRFLPDRGYAASKALGLLMVGWVFWLGGVLGWVQPSPGGVVVGIVAILAAGSVAHLKGTRTPDTRGRLHDLRDVIAIEMVFAFMFVAACLVRSWMPRIETAGGEKWMEIAFLNSVLRSESFPPPDPWLSGFAISYYYFGYVLVAMLAWLSGVPASIAFNLAVATLFGLTGIGAYGILHNLLRVRKCSGCGSTAHVGRVRNAALLAPLLVAVTGNLEVVLEIVHARGIGPASFWQWLDMRGIDAVPPTWRDGAWVPQGFYWWWHASRVVRDRTPWGDVQEVIDEFPAFSFILGDLHPHVLALPFVLLAIALALNLFVHASQSGRRGLVRSWDVTAGDCVLYGICLGALGFLNTWDFPIYLFLFVVCFLLGNILSCTQPSALGLAADTTWLTVKVVLVGVLAYLPFWLGFQSQAGGILPNLFNPTRLPHFLVMFGIQLVILFLFLVRMVRARGVGWGRIAAVGGVTWLSVSAALAAAIGALVVGVRVGWLPARGVLRYIEAWITGGPIPGLEDVPDAHAAIGRGLFAHVLNPWTALLLAGMLAAVLLLLRRAKASPGTSHSDVFALLLVAVGLLLVGSVEYVYLQDTFGTRMNTVFKFYFQTWVLWSLAAGYALSSGQIAAKTWGAGVVGILVLAGLLYPCLAIPARARESGAGSPTLDGLAYLEVAHPEDHAAIVWLNRTVNGSPVILEAPGDRYAAYTYSGRVSAQTGLPTLLGWGGHQLQWRGDYDEPSRREPDIEKLYSTTDRNETLTLLDKYDISYVYVGPLEQERYPANGLAKFGEFMEVVYTNPRVTIYHR
ncbi:MAG: hypothetical protein GX620_00125 [Chloroflexi bacterium]|nr:hypothetical protein [Chloroflexota bacterium]